MSLSIAQQPQALHSLAQTQPVNQASKAQAPAQKAPQASSLKADLVETTPHKGGLKSNLITFGAGTLAGLAAGAGTGAVAGRILGGSRYANTGISLGILLGGVAGGITGLAVNSMGAVRDEHSVALGAGAGAAVGVLTSVVAPLVVGGGTTFEPMAAAVFSVVGAAAGAAAAYTAVKAND